MSDQLNNLDKSQKARRKNLANWRASLMHDLILPSGLKVKVRDVTMTDLMLTGKLPDVMLEMAQDASSNGAASVDLKQLTKNAAELALLMDALIKLAVVDPPITDQGDDDHLGLAELNGDDKMFIFNWVNREVEQLRPFREGEAEPVAVVQPGDGLRIEAQPAHVSGNGNSPVVS